MAMFTYGSGCPPPKHGNKDQNQPAPCLMANCNSTQGRHSNTNSLPSSIYKVMPPSMDEDKHLITQNHYGTNPRGGPNSPVHSPESATSPSKMGICRDPTDTIYGTLRKEVPTLKAVPPPTLPSSLSSSQNSMLVPRSKKTVTICDSTDVGRAASPVSIERI